MCAGGLGKVPVGLHPKNSRERNGGRSGKGGGRADSARNKSSGFCVSMKWGEGAGAMLAAREAKYGWLEISEAWPLKSLEDGSQRIGQRLLFGRYRDAPRANDALMRLPTSVRPR